VSTEEIHEAARAIKLGKASGPDNTRGLALRIAMETHAAYFRKVFNTCLPDGVFPERWKQQNLVLIPKGTDIVCFYFFGPLSCYSVSVDKKQ